MILFFNFDVFDVCLKLETMTTNWVKVFQLEKMLQTLNANKNLVGTCFAKLIPGHSKQISVSTIPGIFNLSSQLVSERKS